MRSIVNRNPDRIAVPVGVAVVGLGYWGPNLIRVLRQENTEIAWICDLDHERLTQYRRRYPGARSTTQFDRVSERS